MFIFMPTLHSFPILLLYLKYITNLSYTLVHSNSARFKLIEEFNAKVL